MDSANFEINGVNYTAMKLDAMRQFHIVRRLAPVLAGLIPQGETGLDLKAAMAKSMATMVPKLADILAKLSDADAEFVIYGLLSSVKREEKQGLGWSNLVVNGQLMFKDISMPDMIKIALRSGQLNFKDFLAALPQASNSAN